MTAPNPTPHSAGGGSVATRGLLVQTLIALLDVAQPESSFSEITLEPAVGNEQFDFLWTNKDGSYATQVKSTINSFIKADVERWAGELEAARSTEHCRLMLVGNIPPSLVGLNSVGAVVIEAKNLHLDDLVEQAAHRLAAFLEDEGQPSGTAAERVKVVHALASKLQHLAAASERFSREEFIKLLRRWLKDAPRQSRPIDISRIIKYAPAELIGRDDELKLLNDAWARVRSGEPKRPNVLSFVALGGEGKTSLVAKWAADLAHQDWAGCDAVFAWSFYSQGTREQLAASSDLFLKEALSFFGDDTDKHFAAGSSGPYEKGQRLARIVGQRRNLLILDGLEPLQYSPASPTPGELRDQGVSALLKALAAASNGLCVVTSRYSLPDLKAFWQTTAPEVELLRLSRDAGVHLLKTLGLRGTAKEFEMLVEDVKGHALTLTLLGGFLKRAFHGDIRQRDRVKFEKADDKIEGGHAFRTMAAYEQWLLRDGGDEGRREVAVLRLLGLFDRPADAGCLAALRSKPIPGLTKLLAGLADDDWEFCLSGLEAAKLLTVNRDAAGTLVSLDAHPLLREYFAHQLRARQPEAWRAAHRRLYEHLRATTPDKDAPTLDDLQPLYQAVAHGCQANRAEETCQAVFRKRIQRGELLYSRKRLGAVGSDLGALLCFFKSPWRRPLPQLSDDTKSWVLGEASFCLLMLGRHPEAINPRQIALDIDCERGYWNGAALNASYLGELHLQLGNISKALRLAKSAETFAMLCDDTYLLITIRCALANALHYSGPRSEAISLFRMAENLQTEREPKFPLLYTDWGAMYCDALLAAAERGSWSRWLRACSRGDSCVTDPTELLVDCRVVERRAQTTLKWAIESEAPLRSQAKDHLTLGRVALYIAVLSSAPGERHAALDVAREQTTTGVAELRRYGSQAATARALLPQAWLRFLEGNAADAQTDLNEAWEIAQRGSMKLYLADIHLYRARLFFREKEYPKEWISPQADLAAAEKLINHCGYHRRDEELVDAKRAILGT